MKYTSALRSHTCGALRSSDIGSEVRLCGWVDTVRDHGGVLFIDLRDFEGKTQVTLDPEGNSAIQRKAQQIRSEFVLSVSGTVEGRPAEMVNSKLATGEVEVRCSELVILNSSETPPFPLDDKQSRLVSEDLRLAYRYLDLRRPEMQRNMRQRHAAAQGVRRYLDRRGFVEVETPILTRSTPEGARDYLVPSRMSPGRFFALPQAPQQYKQLLMMGGMDRYFQIARCFRDEDQRLDRQPEFTQVDIEMAFVQADDILNLVDGLLAEMMTAVGLEAPELPLPRMTYDEAMGSYGSDRPDLRFDMRLVDVSSAFANTDFKVFRKVLDRGGVVKAINASTLGDVPIRVMDEWTGLAQQAGLGGLAYIRVQPDGAWKSPIVKFFSDAEREALQQRLAMAPGDLVLFAADRAEVANSALGQLRLAAARYGNMIPDNVYAFTWVTGFPLFELTEEGRLHSMHHPFTAPREEDRQNLQNDPESVRAQAYDVVLNGVELGGGSIRIHQPELQHSVFRMLGMEDREIEQRFGHMVKALSFGAPPHGGIALGFDRILMLLLGASTIRDVIAFPKTQKALDLLMGAPAEIDAEQLRDVHLRLDMPHEGR